MGIDIKLVETIDENQFRDMVHRNLESAVQFIPEWEFATAGDQEYSRKSNQIRVGAFDGDALVGFSVGRAASKNRFTMEISLVEPEYRKRGIYSRMLQLMLDETKIYDEVDSYHQLFNNPIIRLKLAHEFYIVGIDQSILLGPRVRMRYFHNEKLRELMKYRVSVRDDPRPNFS